MLRPFRHVTNKLWKILSIAIPEAAALMANILGAQMRAARALLRWSAADLVRESGVSLATIHRAETVDGKTAMTLANASAIRRAFEDAGVELIEENGGGIGARLKQRLEFINENGGGPGVRLRKTRQKR
jgi:hypothetical protein